MDERRSTNQLLDELLEANKDMIAESWARKGGE